MISEYAANLVASSRYYHCHWIIFLGVITIEVMSIQNVRIWHLRDATPVLIHRWLRNDAQSLKWRRRVALLFFKVNRQSSKSHGRQICDFDQKLAFLDFNSSLNSLMALKLCTKLDVAQKRCPIVSRCHLYNFKVIQALKSMAWIQFE